MICFSRMWALNRWIRVSSFDGIRVNPAAPAREMSQTVGVLQNIFFSAKSGHAINGEDRAATCHFQIQRPCPRVQVTAVIRLN